MLRKFKLKPLLVISFNDFNNFLSFLTIHRFVWFQCNHLYDIKPGKWAGMYSCVKGLPTNCLSGVGTVRQCWGFFFLSPFILAFLFINSLSLGKSGDVYQPPIFRTISTEFVFFFNLKIILWNWLVFFLFFYYFV